MSLYAEVSEKHRSVSSTPGGGKALRVLVVEDEEAVSKLLKDRLESDGYRVECAADAAAAEERINSASYDLLILDLSLPRRDGVDLLRWIRGRDLHLPVLVLTGRSHVEDRIKTLDLGADDYLTKPFEYGELVARLRALLRRTQTNDLVWRFDDLELNRMERTVKRAGRPIDLTAKEFALLEYLMLNSGQRLTRSMIMERVWKLEFNAATNVVDVYINYLRNKVDRGFENKLIRTVRGVGYQLGREDGLQDASGPIPTN